MANAEDTIKAEDVPGSIAFNADLASINLAPGERVFKLKIKNASMRVGFAKLFARHETFDIEFAVPTEKKDGHNLCRRRILSMFYQPPLLPLHRFNPSM